MSKNPLLTTERKTCMILGIPQKTLRFMANQERIPALLCSKPDGTEYYMYCVDDIRKAMKEHGRKKLTQSLLSGYKAGRLGYER